MISSLLNHFSDTLDDRYSGVVSVGARQSGRISREHHSSHQGAVRVGSDISSGSSDH